MQESHAIYSFPTRSFGWQSGTEPIPRPFCIKCPSGPEPTIKASVGTLEQDACPCGDQARTMSLCMRRHPMTRFKTCSFLLALLLTYLPIHAYSQDNSILTYHAGPSRSGNFVVPALTWERARSLHLDEHFQAQVSGHIYAQPLYWQPAGSNAGMLLIATEDAAVYALD